MFEVLGIGGRHKLFMPEMAEALVRLAKERPFTYAIVEGVHLSEELFKGSFLKLSAKQAEARLEHPVPTLSNLKMHIIDADGHEIAGALYGKVIEAIPGGRMKFSIRFTSMSPEVATFLRGLLEKSRAETQLRNEVVAVSKIAN